MNKQHYKNVNPLLVILVLICLALSFNVSAAIANAKSPAKADDAAKIRVTEGYGKLSLSFEANRGQTDKKVQFVSRGSGYGLFLTPTEAVLSLHKTKASHADTGKASGQSLKILAGKSPGNSLKSSQEKATTLRMKLVGANPNLQITGMDELPGKVNYFRGNDPKQWNTHIPTYAKVKYEKVYPGVDLIYYGNQQQLEYDFIVAPGADPKAVRLAFEGADKLNIDTQGDVVLHTAGGDMRLHKPLVYQVVNGKQHEIEGRYKLHPAKTKGHPQVGFQVAAYDKSKPLIIDPVLVYSTYLGGSNSEALCGPIVGIAVDSQGNAYVAGSTASLDFPSTAGAFDTTHNPFGDSGYTDAFVAKINATGSALVYVTYLGGSGQASTCGTDIAVDNQGNAYVIGNTGAGVFNIDFPTTPGAFDTEFGPNSRIEFEDGFVAKLDNTGSSLVYSTFLGGNQYDFPLGIAVDIEGNAYITGWTDSGNFPTTPGGFAPAGFGGIDAFAVKLNAMGNSLVYSTYLGGMNADLGNNIALGDTGSAYVAGRTHSPDFPTTPGAFDTNFNYVGGFVTHLNETGSALLYSTFLGGSSSGGNELFGIAVDATGNAYVTGTTYQADFPSTPGAFDTSFNGLSDATITKLNASGTALIYSTYLGGSDNDNGSRISVDTAGNASITGNTCSTNFPIQNPLQATNAGACDGFVVKLDSPGSSLIYATYLGGSVGFLPGQSAYDSGSSIAVDSVGNVYVAGITASSDFPTTPGALKTSINGNIDAFVAKISDAEQSVLSATPASLDFGTRTIGIKKDLQFTVTNTGTGTLTGTVSTFAPYSIVSGGSFSLGAGASQPVVIGFSPTAQSFYTGNVSFSSNGGDISRTVTGTGGVQANSVFLGVNTSSNPTGSFAEPVNTAIGNYYYQHTDLSLPGRGLPLVFTRTLNVQDANVGPFGSGWTHSYNLKLTENPDSSVVIKMGDGHQEFYDSTGGGTYQPHDPGMFNTLVKNGDGTFKLIQKNQTRMAFTATGRLSGISDRNGNSLGFTYDGNGNLITITDTVGRNLTLSYGAGNRVISLADPSGRSVQYAYDANGHLISDTDPKGGVQQYQYTADGILNKIIDRRGHTLVANTYDASKRVVNQTNGKGAVTTFAYDTPAVGKTSMTYARGGVTIHEHDVLRRLISETDPLGHTMSYVYDANNNRTSITDKNGKVTAFTYDSQGNVTSKTDAKGNVTSVQYNSFNDPTQVVNALGHSTAFAYDAKGNLIQVTDALNHITGIAYDALGQPISTTNARGFTTANNFDAQGNLTEVKDALNHSTHFVYDAIGRRTGMTDANGYTSSFDYDNNGNLLSVTDALGHISSFTYDAQNNRTGVTDPLGHTAAIAYDTNDQPSQITDALSYTVQFAYNATNNRTGVTDPRGNSTQYAYDLASRLTRVTDALGKQTQLVYDANGNLLTQTNPLGHAASFVYDELNRLVSAKDALNHQGFRSYDALGRLIQSKDASGRITQYAYDALNRLTKVTDPTGGTVAYAYDEVGNRTAITDPNGHTTTFVYDALNRLLQKTDPLNHKTLYAYDGVGNRTGLTDAKGQLQEYAYDANNRLIEIAYPDNSVVQFVYDAAGNRTKMTDTLGVSTYAYDALNRLTDYTDPYGKTVSNEYDPAGNRNVLVYPDGKKVNYAYDALNRMASVTDWLNGVTAYSYDDASNLAQVVNPNQTAANYAYDNAERLVQLTNVKLANNSVLASYTLNLDAVGNRTSINRNEPVAPLLQNKTETYAYDDDNSLLNVNGNAAVFDANGNQTQRQGKTYNYDFEDRLVAVTGAANANYSYDGTGNRIKAIRNGSETRYTLDIAGSLSNVLVENDANGNPQAYYVHGLGLISRIIPNGDVRYYHYNTIGSTAALTDSTGAVTNAYAYDAFGQILNQQNGANAVNNPFRYVGQFGVMEEGNGLQFMRARYYEAGVGRFVSKDPLMGIAGNNQSLNLYIYVLDNPIRLVDITGLLSKEVSSSPKNRGIELIKNLGGTLLNIRSLLLYPTKPILPFIFIPKNFPLPAQDTDKIVVSSNLSSSYSSQFAAAATIGQDGTTPRVFEPDKFWSWKNFRDMFCDHFSGMLGCSHVDALGDIVEGLNPALEDEMRRSQRKDEPPKIKSCFLDTLLGKQCDIE